MIRGTIKVDTEICKGCELCITACPQKSLGLSNNINSHGFKYVELIQDNCTGCINCALVCPDSAITVYRQSKNSIKQNKKVTV
ncbi:MAG: 4Fe-4S ferredoxin [Ignavibacteriales bacterium CG12_big_fil_rev_8_21_14_0_65_30_8]|nr:MAG: 4Fe-4S ferredoxin [Ignavibacteriales bacterium CG12_big_fil_rev_8_21_14_0_65_30_8]